MGIQPPGGSSPQPVGQPQGADPQQVARDLKKQLSLFVDGIRNIVKHPHLAESSALDSLATTIEHLKHAATRAARLKG